MTDIRPLSAAEIRSFVRKHAEIISVGVDNLPNGLELDLDDAAAVAAGILVKDGPMFCDLVSMGTGLSDPEIQAMLWPKVVDLGCKVIEATRESWRSAWPNRFLQNVVAEELTPYLRIVRGIVS